jgi:TPR repeat protein
MGKELEKIAQRLSNGITNQRGKGCFSAGRLGLCYEPGKGVTKDRSEAVKWYQKAAARGNKEAQERLSK